MPPLTMFFSGKQFQSALAPSQLCVTQIQIALLIFFLNVSFYYFDIFLFHIDSLEDFSMLIKIKLFNYVFKKK